MKGPTGNQEEHFRTKGAQHVYTMGVSPQTNLQPVQRVIQGDVGEVKVRGSRVDPAGEAGLPPKYNLSTLRMPGQNAAYKRPSKQLISGGGEGGGRGNSLLDFWKRLSALRYQRARLFSFPTGHAISASPSIPAWPVP